MSMEFVFQTIIEKPIERMNVKIKRKKERIQTSPLFIAKRNDVFFAGSA